MLRGWKANQKLSRSDVSLRGLQEPNQPSGRVQLAFLRSDNSQRKEEPVRIFEVFNERSDKNYENKLKAAGLFEEALNPYLKRNWEEAIEGFKECESLLPEDFPLRCT